MRPHRLVFVLALLLGGCTVTTHSSDGSSGGNAPASSSTTKTEPPAEVAALFGGELAEPTPDTMRGTWSFPVETTAQGTVELRIHVTPGRLVVGAHCMLSHEGKDYDVVAGQAATLESNDLEAAQGSFYVQEEVNFQGNDGPAVCSGRFGAGKWNFAVSGTDAELSQEGKSGSVTLVKEGD